MKTFRVLLKSHPDPKGVEILGTNVSFTGFHGFLRVSGGQGEAFFALQDVAAILDEAALLGSPGNEIDVPPGSVGTGSTVTVPPGSVGTTIALAKSSSTKRKRR